MAAAGVTATTTVTTAVAAAALTPAIVRMIATIVVTVHTIDTTAAVTVHTTDTTAAVTAHMTAVAAIVPVLLTAAVVKARAKANDASIVASKVTLAASAPTRRLFASIATVTDIFRAIAPIQIAAKPSALAVVTRLLRIFTYKFPFHHVIMIKSNN